LDGWLGVFRKENKYNIYSYSVIGLPWECKWKKSTKWRNFFFLLPQFLQLHVTPHNPYPLTHIRYHWKHVDLFLKKVLPIVITLRIVVVTFLWPICFYKEFSFDTKRLLCPLIFLHTLHFTLCTLPLAPTMNFTPSNVVTSAFWKQWFKSYIFFYFVYFLT